jgi:hypothetical protein
MASLSPQGIILNPSKRSKGPLFFCIFPGLTEPVFLKNDNEEEVKYAYVVNAYIHLLPMGQGQSVDKAAKKAAKPTPPNPKKPRMQPYQPDLQSTMSSLVNEVRQLRALHCLHPLHLHINSFRNCREDSISSGLQQKTFWTCQMICKRQMTPNLK